MLGENFICEMLDIEFYRLELRFAIKFLFLKCWGFLVYDFVYLFLYKVDMRLN